MEGLCYTFVFCVLVGSAAAAAAAAAVADPHWYPATATWYGPGGRRSDGGACGYGSLVDVKPFRARVGAVSPVLFKGGEGCGACYKVKCLDQSICSRRG
ncbi:UNVERIFIED_CONTAM: Expansin-B3 [Sesamum radiatum]|uniref:Expansin-B3 n=1 Tax=Sesamum radiatum TaxID=300843 RepID=A0AAW2LM90_SESRA